MHARICAHDCWLVLELLAPASIPGEVKASADNPGCSGQTVIDSAQFIGVSREALQLLHFLSQGEDRVGDIYWQPNSSGQWLLAWKGDATVALHPRFHLGSSQFQVGPYHTIIENQVSEAAIAVIERQRHLLMG